LYELIISIETPRAELVAAFCPAEAEHEIAWFDQHLAPFGVKLYNDYDEMLKHPKLQAVVIATVTTVHAGQAIKAIEADKHVLCEKPLSTSVEIVCGTRCNFVSRRYQYSLSI
jgi:myo-inositol 2-dehydrogenase/D-chiro-inositol 1-dehydrogenase